MKDQRDNRGRFLTGHIPLNVDQSKYLDYKKKLQKLMKKEKKEGKK